MTYIVLVSGANAAASHPHGKQDYGLLTRGLATDSATFRNVLSHFASGVVIVTARTGRGPVGMTFQSFFSVSLAPPLVALSPSRGSTTWPHIREARSFCVNVLRHDQGELCRVFGMPNLDRFAGVSWRPAPHSGAPMIDGALAWLDCSIEAVHDAGDHYLVLAGVIEIGAASGEPLVIYRRSLGSFTR